MDQTPEQVVRIGYQRYADRDLAGVFELLSPQIAITQTTELPWGGDYQGLDGARRFFTALAAHTTGMPEPSKFISAGERVAVIGRLRGTANASGKAFDLDIVHVWTVEGGRITRFEAYIDTPAMKDALNG